MYRKSIQRYFLLLITLFIVLSITPLSAMAVTVTGVSGVEVTCTSPGSISESNGSVTVSVTNKNGVTRQTTTVTVKNISGSTATISFDYNASNYNLFDLSDKASGTYTKVLGNNETITFNLRSQQFGTANSTKATANLSNFNVATVTQNDVALSFDSSHGSVTMDGTGISEGTYSVTDSTFVATAKSGAEFLGWINPDTGFVISTDTSYRCAPNTTMKLEAVFAGSDSAWFYCSDKTYLFDDLTAADNHAKSATTKTIVLANNGTLTGAHTISSGVTLLIPFNDAYNCYTTTPGTLTYDHENGETFTSVYTTAPYRTLTMASGANITVNGTISVSAKHSATMGSNGSPIDAYGHIKMNSESTITVENGGTLYAWGYITGSGAVTAKSGATVYENFQLRDWRGGNATSSINDDRATYRVFPFSQYFVQNIEVPLTLFAGATEYARMSVSITLLGSKGTTVPFIGTEASMFVLSNGYIVKDYVEGTGRIKINVCGDFSFSPISITIDTGIGQSVTLNTAEYVLPISNHMTVDIQSGTVNIAQDMSLQPGCEIYLREGANFVLGEGKSIYIYDSTEWGGYCYNNRYRSLNYVPGGNGTTGRDKDVLIQVDGNADLSAGYTYTTSSGANICSTGTGVIKTAKGSETVTYQVTQSGNTVSAWNEIPITPAQLLNGDGTTYVATGTSIASPNTYTYAGGKWICEKHTDADADNICDVCGVTICDHANTEVQNATEATCTEDGYSGDKVCTACGTTVETGTVITAAGSHSGGTATCTEKAKCGVCGQEYGEAMGHSWNDATCTVPKTCSVCKQTEGTANNHSYTSSVTKEATCKEAGVMTYTCVCGESYTEEIAKLTTHTPGAAATCTAAQTCTVCNAELAAAKGHTWVDADCDTPKTCSVCKVTEGEAKGHSYDSVVTAPTCEAAGYTTHTCSVCGDSYTDSGTAALGHTPGDVVVENNVAASCTAAGSYDNVTYCTACGTEASRETITVDALGHTPGAAATCTTAQTCTVCNAELAAAKGHTYANPLVTFSDDGTTYTVTVACSVCAEGTADHTKTSESLESKVKETTPGDCKTQSTTTYTASGTFEELEYSGTKTVDGELGAHDLIQTAAKAVTCQNAGNNEYYTCSIANCGKVFKADKTTETTVEAETIAQLDHADTDNDHICNNGCNEKISDCSGGTATCMAQAICGTCGKAYGDLGSHTMTHHEAVAPNCTKDGTVEYWSCSVCGKNYADANGTEEQENIVDPAKGHTPGAAATCTAPQTCTVCGTELTAAKGHSWNDATCTAPKTCSVCKQTEGTANNHSYTSSVTKEATCKEAGVITYTCVCGESYTEEIAKLTTHTPGAAATCTTAQTCTVCNAELAAAKGHDMQETTAAVAPTCTAPGSTAVLTCANGCGKTEGGEAVDALDHKDENKDHTCDSGCDVYQGIHTDSATDNDHVCDYCGKEIENGETCSDVTTDQDHKCDICGKEDVTKHEYTSEVTAPTCTTDGYTTHTCNCGHSYTDSKVAANHTIEQGMAQAKTCTQDGWEAYEYCTQCDYSTKVVIPAGHTLTQVEAKTPTCAEKGWEAYEKCSECTHTTYKEILATGNHTYDNACDADCNVCAATRASADHVYDNTCDTSCNVCGDVRSITHSWNAATCTAPKTCSVCGATEGEATGHVNTTSSTVQNSDGTHTITVTCGCTYVVSAKTVPCTDAGNGSCVCGRVMAAKVNVENKTKANDNDLYSISGTTLNVKHDLACVVLVKETDGTYTRLNATANANGGYDFDVSGVGDKTVVIAVKGDVTEDGIADSADVMLISRSCLDSSHRMYKALTGITISLADVTEDEVPDSADVMLVSRSCLDPSHRMHKQLEWS